MNKLANHDLNFVQGETVLLRITVQGVDLTGYAFSGQIRDTNGLLLAPFGFDDSALASGYVTAIILPAVSAGIKAWRNKYDIFATAPDGASSVIAKGNCTVTERVTQS